MASETERFLTGAIEAWMAEPDAIPKLVVTNYRLHSEKYELMATDARLTAENAALAERVRALEEAGQALAARSPCFLTIRPGGDIECCQFCLTDNGHADDCEWVAFCAALAAAGGDQPA